MSDVPIPTRLTHRPTAGGLVVPYVSVSDGTHHLLGNVHHNKAMTCVRDRLCQICGQPLGTPLVVLVSESSLGKRYSSEAALHPECATYSVRACPMLAGQMDTYRATAAPLHRIDCFEAGCDCGGWTNTSGLPTRIGGEPAERWYAVWLNDYQIVINDARRIHGLAWRGHRTATGTALPQSDPDQPGPRRPPMTTITLTRPTTTTAATTDDDLIHYTCCDDNTAMCGLDVTGEDWVNDDGPDCRHCAYIADNALPCPDPDCDGGEVA